MGQFLRAEDLLRGPNAKKAAIKGASAVGPLFGACHAFSAMHGDGNALKLEFQVRGASSCLQPNSRVLGPVT